MFMQLPNRQLFRWMEKDRSAEGFPCVANFIESSRRPFRKRTCLTGRDRLRSHRSRARWCLFACKQHRAETTLVAKKAEVCFVSNTFAL